MLKHKGTLEISSERLVLRRYKAGDGAEIFETWSSNHELAKYMKWSVMESAQQAENFALRAELLYEHDDFYRWNVCQKQGGKSIGFITLAIADELDMCASLAYCIGSDFSGHGYATEAVRAVIDFAFSVGFERVEADHSVNNPASGKVMERAGLQYEGTMRHKHLCNDGWQDCKLYAIVKG